MSETITAKQAVEKLLAQRLASDPGFIAELTLDPDGAVKPLIAQVLSDDGDVDLSSVAVTVHVETDDRIHLVVPAGAGADVEGFSFRQGAGATLRNTGVRFDPMGGGLSKSSALETASGICICKTEDCETQVLCDWRPKGS